MRRFNNQKKKLSMTIALVLIVFVGLAYAFLNEKLIINNILSYNSMNFEVGFIDVTDGGGTIKPTSTVSNDGKTINISCNIGNSTDQESCITKATIINNSSFNIGLSNEPKIIYDDTYIHTLTVKWKNHPTFLNSTVHQNGFIKQGESEEIVITVKTKFLDKNNLPEAGTQIPITIEFDFVEYSEATLPKTTDLAILPATNCSKNGDYLEKSSDFNVVCPSEMDELVEILYYAKKITFKRGTEVPQEAVDNNMVLDFTDKIKFYAVLNKEDSDYFDVYIQSEEQLYADLDMSYLFVACVNAEEIVGLDLFDTSMTDNMEGMFFNFGVNAESVNLDLSSLDTSNVTNMSYMFMNDKGSKVYSNYSVDTSNFDTSNVQNMSYMFASLRSDTGKILFDTSNFDTSNVTTMRAMFAGVQSSENNFELDLSNFNTSRVEDMRYMFFATGMNSTLFTLDVSAFDTSKVTNMSYMFSTTGYNSTVFTLDVSGFDTSKVTDMSWMFYSAGYSNPTFTLDVSNFDTSEVTDMYGMFESAGYINPTFILDVSNFDTSEVTDMYGMFYHTGYNSTIFTLDVSNFDTSKVTDMRYMFSYTGYNSTKLNTTITIRNPNVSYSSMFSGVATKEGTQITVNYTSDTESIIDNIIDTKSTDANVVRGSLVE